MGDFLDFTNLSELEGSTPQATSTVLPKSRTRSTQQEVSDVAKTLFRDTLSEESHLLLRGSLETSLLDHSTRQEMYKRSGKMEDSNSGDSHGATSSYLKDRFDISENDLHLQQSLGLDENFSDGAAQIAKDEQQFEEEHFLKVPQEGSFPDSSFPDSLEGTDIATMPRPSWLCGGSEDLITMSAYLRSRSAPMEYVLEHSPLFPDLGKADASEASMTSSTSIMSSIQDLVNEELGLGNSACNGQQTDEPRNSSAVHKPSVSDIDRALEDVSLNDSNKLVEKLIGAACRRAKGLVKQHSSSNSDKTKQQEDGCFKRPLAAAPRARSSQQLTPTTSALRAHFSSKGPANTSSCSSSSRIASSCAVQSPRKYKSHLSNQHKVTSSHTSDLVTSMKSVPTLGKSIPTLGKSVPTLGRSVSTLGKSVPKRLQKPPASPHHRPRTVHRHVEHQQVVNTEVQARSQISRLSSLSSPDLRSSKSRDSDQQSVARLNSYKSDESLNVSERDVITEREKGAMSRNRSSTGGSHGASSGSSMGSASKFLSASSLGQSPTYLSTDSGYRAGPAPLGLLLPKGFVQRSLVNLGKVCAGARQAVTIALVNPTAKTESYELQQHDVRVGGQAPGQLDTVAAEFPGRHDVCAGCVSEVQGFFVSTCPGAVEIEVSVAAENETGNIAKHVHSLVLSAQVEHPRLSLEPSQGLNFEGLHFDMEDGDSSRCSREITVVNESSCPVPISVCVRGGSRVFSLRLKDATTHKLGQAATVLHVVLPSGPDHAVAHFLVECSTKSAECLAINAKLVIEVDGCLLFSKVLAAVGLSASIVEPSLSLEGINRDEPINVGAGKGQATVLMLRNDGPCSFELELSAGPLFRVSPRNARIQTRGSVELFIRAAESSGSPAVPCTVASTSILEAVLVPQGFRVALARLASPSQQHAKQDTAASSAASSRSGCGGSGDWSVRTLESTRRVLLWAGMHASSSESKCLTIRNPNSSPVSLELELAGQCSKLFRARMAGARDTKSGLASTQLEAGRSVEVKVTHSSHASLAAAPAEGATAAHFAQSKLIIKSRCGHVADTKSVALYAFSGRLQVDIRDTLSLGPHRHLVDIGALLSEGNTATKELTLFNGGDWDACVHFATPGSVFLGDSQETTKEGGCGELDVSPSCVVLRRKQTKVVTLTYRFGAASCQPLGKEQIKAVANMRVLHGFEALRQAAKRSFAKVGGRRQPSRELQPFLGAFEDEGQIDAIPVSRNLAEEVFLKTVSQAAMAVIVSTGAAATLLQASTSASSFAPLEDPTLLGRLSWLDVPE